MAISIPEEQLEELRECFGNIETYQEGGFTYVYIPKLPLPDGCSPTEVKAILCPELKDGYFSRLYLSQVITGCPIRNWTATTRIIDHNWSVISWQSKPGLSLFDMVGLHLNAFDPNGTS